MARELLTSKGLEAALKRAQADAAARQTRAKIRDGDNLILIVRPNGGASWVLQYRAGGKRLPLTSLRGTVPRGPLAPGPTSR